MKIPHLHWMTSLGKHNVQDQGGRCSLLTMSSWPYCLQLRSRRLAEAHQKALGQNTKASCSRSPDSTLRLRILRVTRPFHTAGSHRTPSPWRGCIHACSRRPVLSLGVAEGLGKKWGRWGGACASWVIVHKAATGREQLGSHLQPLGGVLWLGLSISALLARGQNLGN